MTAKSRSSANAKNDSTANVDSGAKCWFAAANQYKHFVPGLIFLKCIATPRDTLLPKLLRGEPAALPKSLSEKSVEPGFQASRRSRTPIMAS